MKTATGLWEVPPMVSYGYAGDIASAHLKDKMDGTGEKKALVRALMENAGRCGDLMGKLLQYLVEKGFSPESAHLRINGPDFMEVMVCVPKKDFWQDAFLDAYGHAGRLEEEAEEDGLSVSFSFLGFHDGYNAEALAGDGYSLLWSGRRHEA